MSHRFNIPVCVSWPCLKGRPSNSAEPPAAPGPVERPGGAACNHWYQQMVPPLTPAPAPPLQGTLINSEIFHLNLRKNKQYLVIPGPGSCHQAPLYQIRPLQTFYWTHASTQPCNSDSCSSGRHGSDGRRRPCINFIYVLDVV